MNEKLVIHNFGPIKHVDISLKKTTLLIGEQSSGKSTIAKLISIFRDDKFLINPKNKNYFKKYNLINYFEKNTLIEYTCNSYKVIYKDNKIESIPTVNFQEIKSKGKDDFEKTYNKLEITLTKLKEIASETTVLTKKLRNEKNENKTKDNLLTEIKNFNDIFMETKLEADELLLGLKSNELVNIFKDSIYIPAERSLISLVSNSLYNFLENKISLPEYFYKFGSLYEKIRNTKKTIKLELLNLNFKNVKGRDRIYLSDNTFINLSESSSGFQSMIPLILVISKLSEIEPTFHTYIIEEPELNLFPAKQKQIIQFLVKYCTYQKNELVLTTHSPYVLTILNNLLYAKSIFEQNKALEQKICKIVSSDYWIEKNDFTAYYLDKGKAKKIFNSKSGLITENELDGVSIDLSGEFDELINLKKGLHNVK